MQNAKTDVLSYHVLSQGENFLSAVMYKGEPCIKILIIN